MCQLLFATFPVIATISGLLSCSDKTLPLTRPLYQNHHGTMLLHQFAAVQNLKPSEQSSSFSATKTQNVCCRVFGADGPNS